MCIRDSHMRVRLKIKDGKILEGKDQLGALIHSLDGEYIFSALDLSSPNTVEEWRKLYFALRDVLHEAVETGYTKKELHDVIKKKLIYDMMMQTTVRLTDWFTDAEYSTKALTEAGWVEYMK